MLIVSSFIFLGRSVRARETMWNSVTNELREFVWLASMVFGLSVVGVGLSVGLAVALVGIP
jgi:hypothetical protein